MYRLVCSPSSIIVCVDFCSPSFIYYLDQEKGDTTKTTIIIVALIAILLLVSVVVTIIYYIYRKRRQADEKALQLKMDQYNYDMRIYSDEPPVVNYDDMTMGSCIHRGRFGDVSYPLSIQFFVFFQQ